MNSTKDKLKHETPHFGNTLLGAVAVDQQDFNFNNINKKQMESLNKVFTEEQVNDASTNILKASGKLDLRTLS